MIPTSQIAQACDTNNVSQVMIEVMNAVANVLSGSETGAENSNQVVDVKTTLLKELLPNVAIQMTNSILLNRCSVIWIVTRSEGRTSMLPSILRKISKWQKPLPFH